MAPVFEFCKDISIILALGIGSMFVNILLHELGHAAPSLFWSKEKVIVFVGSLGDFGHSFGLTFGRLGIFIKYNPFLWFRGLCRHGKHLSVNKTIFSTAMGPLVSLLITATCFVLLETTRPGREETVLLVTIMSVGGLVSLSSIIPSDRLSVSHSGRVVRNDAMQIVHVWKTRDLPDAYWVVIEKLEAGSDQEASDLIAKMIDDGESNIVILRLAVRLSLNLGNYAQAESTLELIRNSHRFSVEDEINDARHKILVGRYRHAVAIYTELLRIHYNNFMILNNMGYALIAAGEPEKALPYLDRGITLTSRFADLYANRAWARISLRQKDQGLADARRALQLNAGSAGAYRVLGLDAMENGQIEEARAHFIRAKSLDPEIQFVDEPLASIESRRYL